MEIRASNICFPYVGMRICGRGCVLLRGCLSMIAFGLLGGDSTFECLFSPGGDESVGVGVLS